MANTCALPLKKVAKSVEHVEQLVKNNPNMKPPKIQSACILLAVRKQLNWNQVEKEVKSTMDRTWISNIKKKVK